MLDIEREVGEMLVERKMISEDQLMEAMAVSERNCTRLRDTLYETNLVTPYTWTTILSFKTHVPIVDLANEGSIPATEALATVLDYMAMRLKVLPLSIGKGYVRMVVDDPTDLDAITELLLHTGRSVKPTISIQPDLSTAIRNAYSGRWMEYRGSLPFVDSYTTYKIGSTTSFQRN